MGQSVALRTRKGMSLLPRGREGGRRPDEGGARGRGIKNKSSAVKRSPPHPHPHGGEGTRQKTAAAVAGSLFPTACGWMAITGADETVHQLRLGYDNADQLRNELQATSDEILEADWYPELREKLQAYAGGQRVSFTQVRCAFPPLTQFQQDVLGYVKRIPYGKVMSYGEIAAAVGNPGAARAVGTVMSHNRIPLIIPCHRVVASSGKIGNYTCPRGNEMKKWLLNLENAALPNRPR